MDIHPAIRRSHETILKRVLKSIKDNDTNYELREVEVYAALHFAKQAGLQCGFRFDPAEPEWPVAYIELPTGQVSWHMPQHSMEYDGHTTERKYQRIKEYISDDKIT